MKMLLLTLFVALVASAPVEDSGNAVEVVVNGLADGEALQVADIVDIKLKEHVGGEVAAASDLLHPFSAAGIAEAAAVVEIEAEPVQVVDVAENEIPVQVVDEIAPSPIVLPAPIVPEVPVPDPAVFPESVVPESPIPDPAVLPESVVPESPIPDPAVLPESVVPESPIPDPAVLPESVAPEAVPAPVVLPEPVAPEVVPAPIVLPEPVAPEVVPSPVVIPEPVAPEVPETLPVPEHQFGEVYNDGTVQVSVNAPEDAGVIATLQSWLNVVMNYFNNGVQTTEHIL